MKCAAPECNRDSATRVGYCVMHYKRWKRNGDTDRVLQSYTAVDTCENCGGKPPLRKGLCNACRIRLARKGYTELDNRPAGAGSVNGDGYRVHTVNGKRVYEHRMIKERVLDRPLKPKEIVHHDDEDKSNNNDDNLVVFESQSDHMKHHHRSRRTN